MTSSMKWVARFCWSWIGLISLVTIVHSFYRIWWISEGVSGNVQPNLLNPGQSNDPQYIENAFFSYVHLSLGIAIYLLGPIQFMKSVRLKWKKYHKFAGYAFFASILLSGLASIMMALIFPVGGTSEMISSLMFSTIMICCVCRAVYLAILRKIVLHREWMIRAYMIALGPGTMHFFIPLFIQVGGKGIGEALSLSLWMGFTLHLVMAEVWINTTSRKSSAYSKTTPSRRPVVSRPNAGLPERYEIVL